MDNSYSPKSMWSYKKLVRMFWRWFKPAKATPENPQRLPKVVRWIDMRLAKKRLREQPTAPPLTEEEVLTLLRVARDRKLPCKHWQRDRAFIFVHYESMCRIDEDINLKWKDFEWIKDEEGRTVSAVLTLPAETKTGSRKIVLVESVPDLLRWKASHPEGQNPEAYVWRNMSQNSNGKFLSYAKVSALLKNLAKQAGIEKRVHTHLFRASRCTHLLIRGVPQEAVRLQGGWAEGSLAFHRYVRFSRQDRENELRKLAGVTLGNEKPYPFKVKACRRCKSIASCLDVNCPDCEFPLSDKVVKELDKEHKTELDQLKTQMDQLWSLLERATSGEIRATSARAAARTHLLSHVAELKKKSPTRSLECRHSAPTA